MAFLRNDRLTHLENLILDRVLMDTAIFTPRDASYTVDEYGIDVRTPQANRTYNGSSNIPCLFYQSRAFENTELSKQETVANRYYIEVPRDFTFDETDYITVNGRRFEIRKVSGVGKLEFTNEMQLGEIMTDYD